MKTITLKITEGQYAALALDVVEPREWLKSMVVERAGAVVAGLPEPVWRACIVAAVKVGIDTEDADAIVLHALEAGLLRTLKFREMQSEAERENEQLKTADTETPK
ncbi:MULTISPECIES: hypothetical protein [unclassified Mesorhizobium]|uniref:hypothetical protein n=1 Tax=unclassified Mesorhizobium TaxID=325217 RepID=UPI00112EA90D|nr:MULTISPECIES: hypothetical protein [unclassified Mesorhizobium]MBZ9704600.1 hypothetical protein [Mesorhizobium sp. CO1-1-3]MBZ9950360.1 hypothetical protein [Mesorhizobium sp. BR1-1-11]TPI98017.1 hypothetical protein FJ428_25195 [Mesorhizobium sp. B2-8-1]